MKDHKQIDYVLIVENTINEAQTDIRNYNTGLPSVDINPVGRYIGVRDPKLMVSWAFGKILQRELNNLGSNYTCQVFDCGGEVSVTVSCCEPSTGRTASKSFIIVFDSKNGNGTIKSSSTRWRSVSGISQVVTYIKSVASNLSSFTNTNN